MVTILHACSDISLYNRLQRPVEGAVIGVHGDAPSQRVHQNNYKGQISVFKEWTVTTTALYITVFTTMTLLARAVRVTY